MGIGGPAIGGVRGNVKSATPSRHFIGGSNSVKILGVQELSGFVGGRELKGLADGRRTSTELQGEGTF